MNEILNGAPQFILLTLVTGMIYFYSGVLNKVIGKRKKLNKVIGKKAQPDNNNEDQLKEGVRLFRISRSLMRSEYALLGVGYLIVFRILLSIFHWASPWMDFFVIIIYLFAHILLTIVFFRSYFSNESQKLLSPPPTKTTP